MPKQRDKPPMTVGDLIKNLENYDQDLPIVFMYDYNDHWHTNVTPSVESVGEGNIIYSDYHRMNKFVEETEDEVTGDNDGIIKVVILS